MTIGSSMWDSCDAALLALTALERWAGARKIRPHSNEDYSMVLVVALLLVVLVVLLWWVSHRRTYVPPVPARDLFSDGAARTGLGARDRQMLLAIVVRSGLQRRHDIFITPDAFDRAAAQLLEECARSRPAQETERLRAEVAGLREKLAYRATTKGEQTKRPGSRDISVGTTVELLRRDDPGGSVVGAIVIRNDDLGIAVEAQMSLRSAAGEGWRVRYRTDADVWQFDTSTVSCEDARLVLNHGEQVRGVERDRPNRLVIHAPAAVARFPFIQATAMESQDVVQTDWFELVRGVVTQVSDSGLQVRSPLPVQVGERVLVVFALAPADAGEATNDAGLSGHVIGHVGRVEQRQATGEETVITVGLTDLADGQVDELMRLAQAAASGAQVVQGV